MTEWQCRYLAPDGRQASRTILAPSRDGAVAQLQSEGCLPLKVRSGAPTLTDLLHQPIRLTIGVSIAEQALLLAQLATLVRSGLPVDRSLDLLRDQAGKRAVRSILATMLTDVRSGASLASALASTKLFPGYVEGIVRAAERSGKLSTALTSVAERLTQASATRQQLITALTYPAMVLAATIVALVLVLTMVVPQFAPMFEGEEDRLPSLTRFVLTLSGMVIEDGWRLLLAVAGLFLLGVAIVQSRAFDTLARTHGRFIPGLGLRDQHIAGQFTGVLGTLLGNGLTVVAALPLCRGALSSRRWRRHLGAVESRIREGSTLSKALGQSSLVPLTVTRLLEVGERSGRLAETASEASAIVSQAARARIDRIVSLVNPIAIMTLGALVGLLVGGVMLGLFSMGDFAT